MYSDGTWPYDAYENMVIAQGPGFTKWLFAACHSILERLCEQTFADTSVLNFSVDRKGDCLLLCFSGQDWQRISPEFRHFDNLHTHLLHVLPKYVHFIRDDDVTSATVFKIKLHEETATIVERLVEIFGFEEEDEIVATLKGKNVALSWLALPHNPHERELLKLGVTLSTKQAGEDVKYSYSASRLRQKSDKLTLVENNQLKGANKDTSDGYYQRIRHYWKDLNPQMCLFLPQQIFGVDARNLIPKYGVENGTKTGTYKRIGEPCDDTNKESGLKPFSTWSIYFKYCLTILAQKLPNQRPEAMIILYWSTYIRKAQARDGLKDVSEALARDIKVALDFLTRWQKADALKRKGIEKWNRGTMAERNAITDKGKAAHEKLSELAIFDEKDQLKHDIGELMEKIRYARGELEKLKNAVPRDEVAEFSLKQELESWSERKKELDWEHNELVKKWKEAPELTDEEIYDVLAYEYCAFKQKRVQETRTWEEEGIPKLQEERKRMARACLGK